LKVLVTDGSKPCLGIVRSLGMRGVEVGVACAPQFDRLAALSKHASRIHEVPSLDGDDFVQSVIRILTQTNYDVVLPVQFQATLALASRADDLKGLTNVVLPSARKISFAANKRSIYELAARLDVPVPATVYPASFEEVEVAGRKLQYPVVIKPIFERAGDTVRYVENFRQLVDTYRNFAQQFGYSQSDCNLPMLQEFIPGDGVGFFAIYQNGDCKRIFMHRRIRENPPSGGISSCAQSFFDPKLKLLGMRLLDSLSWHGVAMVEFRRDSRDGEYKLMEINPRFWGSLDLALTAGADFAFDLCRIAQGQILEYTEKYDRKLRFHWPLSEDLKHVLQRPSSMWAFFADILNPSVRSDVWFNDPKPHLRKITGFVQARTQRFMSETPSTTAQVSERITPL
jgi:predicted ATP-grasp superfamily ATP-dependent carboligase